MIPLGTIFRDDRFEKKNIIHNTDETLSNNQICSHGSVSLAGKHRRILGISVCVFGGAKYGLKTMEAGDVTRIKSVRVRFCSCGEERWEEV